MSRRPLVSPMACPACPVLLQPLNSTSTWVDDAVEYARVNKAPIPAHGPVALRWLALIAHAKVVHPELELRQYLEDYLDH